MNSKLQILLLILFISFSLSFAHNKTPKGHHKNNCVCDCLKNQNNSPSTQTTSTKTQTTSPSSQTISSSTKTSSSSTQETPSNTQKPPANAQNNSPSTQTNSPSAQKTSSNTQTDSPSTHSTPSDTKNNSPSTQTTSTKSQTNSPSTQTTSSSTKTSSSSTQKTPSNTQNDSPSTHSTPSDTKNNYPSTQTTSTKSQTNSPSTQTTSSSTKTSSSSTQKTPSNTQNDSPSTQTNSPSTQPTSTKTQTNSPSIQTTSSSTKTSPSSTQKTTSSTQTNSSSTNTNSPSTQTTSTNTQCKGAFSKIFAFGDSFTDTGNALALGGLESFVSHLLANSPLTSSLPGCRLSNGRLVIDFLCDTLDLPPLPPFKNASEDISKGVNFAIAGATALSRDFFTAHKLVHSLLFKSIPETFQTQIDWFNKFLDEKDCSSKNEAECKDKMQNALFWVGELGGNDYTRLFRLPISVPSLTELAIGHVSKLIKAMLDRGAKYIVVQGLPPQGCCPLSLFLAKSTDRDDMGCASIANNLIKAHNDRLQKMLAEIRAQHKDCMIIYADYWSAFKTVIENHTKYQFQEPFKACCGAGGGLFNFNLLNLCGAPGTSTCKDPSKFISWDGIHLTEAMNKVVADLFFNKGYCQPSFDQLIKHKKGLL